MHAGEREEGKGAMAEKVMNHIGDLTPDHRNARKHTERNIGMIEKSLEKFGAARSIVVDETGRILAGNGLIEAAANIGIERVKTVEADGNEIIAVVRRGLTEEQKLGLAVADNRAAELADWDTETLKGLVEDGVDLAPFWTADELAAMWPQTVDLLTDEDDVPPVPDEPKSKLGDLYILGEHRLMCGDSTVLADVERLMDGAKADMVFTDPPYGIDYQDVKKNHKKIAGDAELANIQGLLVVLLGFDCPMFICCSWKCYAAFEKAMADAGKPPKACIVWDKTSRVQNLDRFGKQHEFILYHGPFGGEPTVDVDVWECKRQVLAEHPTAKPVELIERAIGNTPGQTILDLFGGSGSTLIAAEKTGRSAFLMELDPIYCDVIVSRWEQATGKKAVLSAG